MMSKVKELGKIVLMVVVALVAISFLPASLKEKIPGVRSIG